MIKNHIFNHGLPYLFRVHTSKLKNLSTHSELSSYLNSIYSNCPNDYFTQNPRASSIKIQLNANIFEVEGHELSTLANIATKNQEKRRAHDFVETFFIERDKKTISTEVPVWMVNEGVISSNILTGHIDILRVEGNKIWVCDYKPKAEKEKFAATQTYLYSRMLSKRTNINLDNFRCCYFDEKKTFIFDPTEAKLE